MSRFHHASWKLQDRPTQIYETGYLPLRGYQTDLFKLYKHVTSVAGRSLSPTCQPSSPKLLGTCSNGTHSAFRATLPDPVRVFCGTHVYHRKPLSEPSLFFHALSETWLFHKKHLYLFPHCLLFSHLPCHLRSGNGVLFFYVLIAEIRLSVFFPKTISPPGFLSPGNNRNIHQIFQVQTLALIFAILLVSYQHPVH